VQTTAGAQLQSAKLISISVQRKGQVTFSMDSEFPKSLKWTLHPASYSRLHAIETMVLGDEVFVAIL
jgi:hypothetical protein